MKGVSVPDLIWTALEYIIILFILLAIFLMSMLARVDPFNDPLGFNVQFTKLSSDPFNVEESLSHYFIDDRYLFEHALEGAVTGSLENSISSVILRPLKDFMDMYERRFYQIEVSDGEETVLFVNSIGNRCGQNFEGICVTTNINGICGAGRQTISDPHDVCDSTTVGNVLARPKELCCVDIPDPNVPRCGPAGKKVGFCDKPVKNQCPEGRSEILSESGDCGSDTMCCADVFGELAEIVGASFSADAPLLYKGETLYEPKIYKCQDMTKTACDGEYVSGLCPGSSDIRCCVTDVIKCRPPAEGFCMDKSHCSGDVVEGACPGHDDYICCKSSQPFRESVTHLEDSDYGPCTLGSIPYYGEPFIGTIGVTVV